MRKGLIAAAVALAATGVSAATVDAAPKDPASTNPNSLVFPIECPALNGGEPFLIWAPNAMQHLEKGHPNLVGHPLGVDIPVGVQKNEPGNKTTECVGPLGYPVYILVTGAPAD